jgi:hypothetical protein
MKPHGNKHGMNWISQVKRLAIYIRDGMACTYCGHEVEDGASLCLDHIRSRCHGGDNHETNLVTACKRCNDSKNSRTYTKFAIAVAAYVNHGLTAKQICQHVRDCARRPLAAHLAEAKHLVAMRGSASKVLATMKRSSR